MSTLSKSQLNWQLHQAKHKSHRAAWLRAAVLGADDGIVSTASLMIGVAAAHASETAILTAGIAGTIAGALSMAAGEYVSVSSQRDSERADIDLEAEALQQFAKEELHELEQIYLDRGLSADLAKQVAKQLHASNALAAHTRDELGINHEALANPLQAAVSSAVSFAGGAVLPLASALLVTSRFEVWVIAAVALLALGILGSVGAVIGGGSKLRAALRVLIGGGLAMVITALIGKLVGATL